MPTAVITGCNSGIGHAFAEVLLKEGYHVYALDVQVGEKLQGLKSENCTISQLDVTDPSSIQKTKDLIGNTPVDVLLNVAGIMIKPVNDTLRTFNKDVLLTSFNINTFGPILLTQALLDNVLAAPKPRHVAVVSSRVGSLTDNTSGGLYAYRASKTAVNSLFKNLAVELKDEDVVVSMLHPGFTKTNLDPDIWKIPDAVEPQEAAFKLWQIVKSKSISDTGRFWHREGMELPW